VSRATSEFALYVVAGRTRASILSAWRYRTVVVAVVTLGSTALLLLLLLLLQRFIAELNRREFQLRKLYDSSLVSILLLQDGRILQANQTTARMFRLPPGRTMAGAHPWEFSPPHQPDGTDSRQRSAQYLETADREGSVTFRWMHKRIDNDEPFAADVNLSSIRIDAHSLTLAIVHDVSELEAAKAQLERANATLEVRVAERTAALEQANARLALANIELEQFTASASHDLRSPLTAISGQAGLLEGMLGAADEQVRQRIGRIQTAVARAADVIDGLLSLSRISRQDLRAEPVCLSTLARQTIEDLRDQYPSRPCRYDIDENVEVVADQRLMKSLLQNLIGNAWKYSAPRDFTYIEFHCEANDGAPVYRVTDHGIGFSMERAGLLFQPFKRLHTPQEFPGTGIGLAIVARIVHRYGGKVWAHAEVGSGATFFFTLPLAQAHTGQAHTGGTRETATRASPAAG
jgi:PAS domain S-box-containing protein